MFFGYFLIFISFAKEVETFIFAEIFCGLHLLFVRSFNPRFKLYDETEPDLCCLGGLETKENDLRFLLKNSEHSHLLEVDVIVSVLADYFDFESYLFDSLCFC